MNELQTKYGDLLKTATNLKISALETQEREGKLHLKGQAPYQMEKDLFWDKLKTYPDWQREVAASITVQNQDVYGLYTVVAGDTLSKLAEKHLGDAKRYMDIFNLNKDVLKDPNMIKVGQKLKLPPKSH